MLLRGKKAGEKIMSFVWIAAMIIVGGGIAIGVGIFYSAEIDVRNVEAEILSGRVLDCFFDNGFLRSDLLESDFDIFLECSLDEEVLLDDFYFRVSFLDSFGSKFREDIGFGKLEGSCTIRDEEGCVRKKRSVIYEKDNDIRKGEVEILTASNQIGNSLKE